MVAIDEQDVARYAGLATGLISFKAQGRFNTLDRPTAQGHWSLLSFYKNQTIINGEYLPQLAGYVELITERGYPAGRVLFEPGDNCERVDHAVLDDDGRVVIMGEAKVDPGQPDDIESRICDRWTSPPDPASRPPKGREYEAWKTADAMWKLRPKILWLTAPGVQRAYEVSYSPFVLGRLAALPEAATLGLSHAPTSQLTPAETRPN
jgi:hypothetical protein